MKKLTFLFTAILLSITSVFAQTPEMFKYQAVLRDASGNILASENLTVDISILQGSASGTSVFNEQHNVTTTAQGLINLNIGSAADLSVVDFSTDTYFIEITIDGTIMGTSQLLSVPYALLAKEVENVDYSQVANTPTIPEDLVDLTDNTNVLFSGSFTDLTNTPSTISGYGITDAFDGTWASLMGKPTFATVATSGSYADLSDTPTIPADVSDLSDNANLLTEMPSDATAGDMSYFDGIIWKKIPAPTANSMVLTYCKGIPTWTADGQCPAEVGDYAHGGVVFYIFQPGDAGYIVDETHGLVSAIINQSNGAQWGCYETDIPGADGTAIGTGAQNTIDIEAACTTTGTAADVCANLDLNGYSDWFLPSKDELNLMYQNKAIIDAAAQANGGYAFTSAYYWSSSEYNAYGAWDQAFTDGTQSNYNKSAGEYVRAVRAF